MTNSNYIKIINFTLFFIIISYAIYLCNINNYGWDWDTYAMLDTFIKIKEEGYYSKSRGAGYLIPEIGIGFLSYYLGSFYVNLLNFIFLILGLFFLFKSLTTLYPIKDSLNSKILLFLILCLTNNIVLRDSTIPMDYSWSFMFFAIGLFSLVKKKLEISIFFFVLCFGSRFNFIAFIIPAIILIDKNVLKIEHKLSVIFLIIFFGSLFYVPNWLQHKFSLDFIYSEQSDFKQNHIFSLIEIGRFGYKVINTFGLINFIFIIYLFIKIRKKIFEKKYLLIISGVNFLIFFIFPWEPSILWLSIFIIYFILINILNLKLIYLIFFINIFNLIYEINVLKINYNDESCLRTPVNAQFDLNLANGLILNLNNRLKDVECYPELLGTRVVNTLMPYKDEIKKGNKLKK